MGCFAQRVGRSWLALDLLVLFAIRPAARGKGDGAPAERGNITTGSSASREAQHPNSFSVVDVRFGDEGGISLEWSDLAEDFVHAVQFTDWLTEAEWRRSLGPGEPFFSDPFYARNVKSSRIMPSVTSPGEIPFPYRCCRNAMNFAMSSAYACKVDQAAFRSFPM